MDRKLMIAGLTLAICGTGCFGCFDDEPEGNNQQINNGGGDAGTQDMPPAVTETAEIRIFDVVSNASEDCIEPSVQVRTETWTPTPMAAPLPAAPSGWTVSDPHAGCDTGACVRKTSCTGDSDCSNRKTGNACDTTASTCQPDCSTDANFCGTGETCDNGFCVFEANLSCTSDADCGGELVPVTQGGGEVGYYEIRRETSISIALDESSEFLFAIGLADVDVTGFSIDGNAMLDQSRAFRADDGKAHEATSVRTFVLPAGQHTVELTLSPITRDGPGYIRPFETEAVSDAMPFVDVGENQKVTVYVPPSEEWRHFLVRSAAGTDPVLSFEAPGAFVERAKRRRDFHGCFVRGLSDVYGDTQFISGTLLDYLGDGISLGDTPHKTAPFALGDDGPNSDVTLLSCHGDEGFSFSLRTYDEQFEGSCSTMTWYLQATDDGVPIENLSKDDVSVAVDGTQVSVEAGLSLTQDNAARIAMLLDGSYSITEHGAGAEDDVRNAALRFIAQSPADNFYTVAQFASEETVPRFARRATELSDVPVYTAPGQTFAEQQVALYRTRRRVRFRDTVFAGEVLSESAADLHGRQGHSERGVRWGRTRASPARYLSRAAFRRRTG
jgi:hypothetical protein